MSLLQVGLNHMGIDLRGLDAGMSQQLLNMADARASLEHDGGAGMTQTVNGDAVRKMRLISIPPQQPTQVLRPQASPTGRKKEQAGRMFFIGEDDPYSLDVFGDIGRRHLAHGHHSIFFSFPPQHPQGPSRKIQVIHAQPAKLRRAQTRGVQKLKHRSISKAQGRGQKWGRKWGRS